MKNAATMKNAASSVAYRGHICNAVYADTVRKIKKPIAWYINFICCYALDLLGLLWCHKQAQIINRLV